MNEVQRLKAVETSRRLSLSFEPRAEKERFTHSSQLGIPMIPAMDPVSNPKTFRRRRKRRTTVRWKPRKSGRERERGKRK